MLSKRLQIFRNKETETSPKVCNVFQDTSNSTSSKLLQSLCWLCHLQGRAGVVDEDPHKGHIQTPYPWHLAWQDSSHEFHGPNSPIRLSRRGFMGLPSCTLPGRGKRDFEGSTSTHPGGACVLEVVAKWRRMWLGLPPHLPLLGCCCHLYMLQSSRDGGSRVREGQAGPELRTSLTFPHLAAKL